MKLIISLTMIVFLFSCSSENSQAKTNEASQSGQFKLDLGQNLGFSHESKKFKVINVTNDYFEFKSLSWHIRFSASQLDEKKPSSSTKLIYNNTFVSFYKNIEGKRTKVSCKPNQDPVGKISITSLENNIYSGKFEFTLIKCNDFYSGGKIESLQLPMTAKGSFNGMAYENHLEKLMNKK